MAGVEKLITEHIDVWTSAIKKRNATGRGSNKKIELTGIKKLRELILELAVRGKLVPQDPSDEPASLLLAKIVEEKAQLVADKKLKKQKKIPEITNEEYPFELPKGWEWSQLGAICEIGPRNQLEDELDVGFVPMPLISTSYKGTHGLETRKWSEIKKGYTHFADGDIGLAKITPCFENSKAAVFSNLTNGYGAGTTELHIARPIKNTIDPLFILLFLKAPIFLEVGKSKMTGSARQKRVPSEYFSGRAFPLAPLAEQRRIVAKVDELMALCDQLEQQTEQSLTAHQTLVEVLLASLTSDTSTDANNKEYFQTSWQRIAEHFDVLFTTEASIEQLKQTILQLAVMGKLVPQNPNDEPASVLLEKIAKEKAQLIKDKKINKQKILPMVKDEEKYCVLPTQWKWVRLGDVLQLISDYHANGSYEILKKNVELLDHEDFAIMLRTTNFSKKNYNSYKYINEQAYHFMSKSKLYDGDIIMNKIGDPGASFYVEDRGQPMSLAMNLFLLRTQIVNSKFVYLYLKSNYEYIKSLANGTSTQTITKDAVYNLAFPLCPLNEQEAILQKVDVLMALCDQLKARLTDAQATQLHLADAVVENALSDQVVN